MKKQNVRNMDHRKVKRKIHGSGRSDVHVFVQWRRGQTIGNTQSGIIRLRSKLYTLYNPLNLNTQVVTEAVQHCHLLTLTMIPRLSVLLHDGSGYNVIKLSSDSFFSWLLAH